MRMTEKDRRLDTQSGEISNTTTKLRDAESELTRLREEAPRIKVRLDSIAREYEDTKNLVDNLRDENRRLKDELKDVNEDAR